MRQDGVLTYLHPDHLGGTALVTNRDGQVVTHQGYWAYGLPRTGDPLPTDRQFTGQQLDSTGLYYYNARYYDPTIGQFISPDTIVPDPTDVFAYNRYLYARGNPLTYTDPTGHQAACAMDVQGNMSCTDNAVTGGHTLSIDLADEVQSVNSDGGRGFLTTMGTIAAVSFGAPFVAPYIVSLLPAAAGTTCADGDCTNEVTVAIPVSDYANRVSQVRNLLNIGQGRNVAIANYNIQGSVGEMIGISGNAVRPGTVNVPTTRLFQTIVDQFPRDFDSEVKILENIAQKFGGAPGIYPNIQGQLTLFSERPLCNSCAGVVQQFQQMFPNIAVEVITELPK